MPSNVNELVINSITNLLEHSILVECKGTSTNDISYAYTKDKIFNTKNGVATFKVSDKLYVAPKYNGIVKILLKNGFRQDYMMHVPFSDGKIPPVYNLYWNELVTQFRLQIRHAI